MKSYPGQFYYRLFFPAVRYCSKILFLVLLALMAGLFAEVANARTELRISAPDLPGEVESNGEGRDAEVVAEVLDMCGLTATFSVSPFIRHIKSFENEYKFDAVMTVPVDSEIDGYSSAVYIWYENGVLYFRGRGRSISRLEDLEGLKLVTFNRGIELLGLDAIRGVGSINEVPDQRLHTKMLLYGRVQAIVADGIIVSAVNRMFADLNEVSRDEFKDLSFVPIFEPTPYKMVFRRQKHQLAFDACLKVASDRGIVEAINEYHSRLFKKELDPGGSIKNHASGSRREPE